MPDDPARPRPSAEAGRQLLNRVVSLSNRSEIHVTLLTGQTADAFEFHRLNLDQGLAGRFREMSSEFAARLGSDTRLARYSAG